MANGSIGSVVDRCQSLYHTWLRWWAGGKPSAIFMFAGVSGGI